ncbi:MAG TPA: hypothetical protein DCY72_01680 [Ruminococcaceae bacterium]|nr:hypothetical protein [Oscillospiraceae bacterium]
MIAALCFERARCIRDNLIFMKRRFKNMKSVKRILSVAVAVLLIAMMMIPAVSAADYSFTLKTTKPGYEFTVYPLATLDTSTGKYEATSNVTDTTVQAAILTSTDSTANLLDACKNSTGLGSGLADKFVSSATSTEKTYNVGAGIYYVKCTDVPVNNKEIQQESIVVLPYKDGTQTKNSLTIDYDQNGKIKELGEPGVEKDFSIDGSLTKNDQTFGSDDTITYVLTADVTGSTANKLTSYIITDTMGTGLDKREESINITSVVLKNGSDTTDLAYDKVTTDIGGATFGVSIRATELDKDAFYATDNKVVVTYTTKLASDAPVNTNIPNTDGLIYSNGSDTKTIPGNTVNAKTYKITAQKIDANTGAPLTGATFTLYKADGTTKITSGTTSGNEGKVTFDKYLAAGTYIVKETGAPDGYNLNSTPQTVVLPGDADKTVVIEDTKAKLPNTGGNGTMMFTIIGGSLVLLAAALFVIVMKKKSSAK